MQYRTFGRTGLKVSMMGMGREATTPLEQKTGRPETELHRLLHDRPVIIQPDGGIGLK